MPAGVAVQGLVMPGPDRAASAAGAPHKIGAEAGAVPPAPNAGPEDEPDGSGVRGLRAPEPPTLSRPDAGCRFGPVSCVRPKSAFPPPTLPQRIWTQSAVPLARALGAARYGDNTITTLIAARAVFIALGNRRFLFRGSSICSTRSCKRRVRLFCLRGTIYRRCPLHLKPAAWVNRQRFPQHLGQMIPGISSILR